MIRLRPVRTFSEKCSIWHLVHQQYEKIGLARANSTRMLFSSLELLPTTTTIAAYYNDELVGSMSAIVSPVGTLPSGDRFEEDVWSFGVDGRIVCEFSRLACKGNHADKVALELMAYMLCWCSQSGIDDAFCVVHPRHAVTWRRLFGWEPISVVKACAHVSDHPGVLMHIDITTLLRRDNRRMSERGRRLLELSRRHAGMELCSYRMRGVEIALALLQFPEALKNSSEASLGLLRRYYPWASRFVIECCEAIQNASQSENFWTHRKPFRECAWSTLGEIAATTHRVLNVLVVSHNPATQQLLAERLESHPYNYTFIHELIDVRVSDEFEKYDAVLLVDSESTALSGHRADEWRTHNTSCHSHTPIISSNAFFELELRSAETIPGHAIKIDSFRHVIATLIIIEALEVICRPKEFNSYAQYLSSPDAWPAQLPAQEVEYVAKVV